MSRHYVPLCLVQKNLTLDEVHKRRIFEQDCINKAIKLAEQTGNQEIQYHVLKYALWHDWKQDHFLLIEEYISTQADYRSLLDKMIYKPRLYLEPEYKKAVKKAENDLNLIRKGLGITSNVQALADKYEIAIDEGEKDE